MSDKAKPETDARGIPITGYGGYPEKPSIPVFYGTFTVIFSAIGYALTKYVVYRSSNQAAADAKLDIISKYDLGWAYAGLFLLRLLQLPVAILLGTARKSSKIGVPDQHVYKVCGAQGSNLGIVLMEQDGILGAFNRAQRAWQNYHETMPTIALQYILSSFVFPFESFVCIAIWSVGRCFQAVGYVQSAEGRMKGGMPGIIALNVINAIMLFVAIQTLL